MRTRTTLASLVLFLGGLAVCLAADLFMGTWKLNEGKSKFSPGATKNTTVVYQMVGDKVKVTVDGVDKDGKAIHSEWTGKFDGQEYPVTGDPMSDMRSYSKSGKHTLHLSVKKGGQEIVSGSIAVSADGKTRTVTTTGTDASGNKMHNTAVYDKE